MNLSFSAGREFSHGFFVQGAYVGRLSRHSLINRDLAMPTDLRDPKSGQTYFQAASQLMQLLFAGTPVANIPKIPFFENMWATAATNQFSATQIWAKDAIGVGIAAGLRLGARRHGPLLQHLGNIAFKRRQPELTGAAAFTVRT